MNNLKYLILIFAFTTYGNFINAQKYEVEVTPITIDNLGGLQSYAVGTHEGEWLLVGGRLDGLHRRQPFASFSADGKNQDLIVVDPEKSTFWRAPLSSLPTSIADQLASTNMQFYQSADKLICTGGYGYSPTHDDHITFPYITSIDLPNTIKAIKENNLNSTTFHQIEHEIFRVTGGALNKIDDTYYLVGGHKFMGRYNPMGPDHGPGFEQEYTDEIRRFKINDEDSTIEVLESIHDAMHLHRRDYNLTPIISEGERKLVVNSGVFKNTVDLPWLYPVTISKNEHIAHEEFTQYYNHYHCAYLPIYDKDSDITRTIFFGGIAQFYKDGETLVQDNDVPFVNTIAEVSRNTTGEFSEAILSTNMPGYLGAGSVFIFNSDAQLLDDDILDADLIGDEYTDIGYIYGGIRSSLPNIFWINEGNESSASEVIYKVSIRKSDDISSTTSVEKKEFLQFYPNPANQLVRMSIDVDVPTDIYVDITDSKGRKIHTQKINKSEVVQGRNYLVMDDVNVGYGAFNYTVKMGNKLLTRRVIWSE